MHIVLGFLEHFATVFVVPASTIRLIVFLSCLLWVGLGLSALGLVPHTFANDLRDVNCGHVLKASDSEGNRVQKTANGVTIRYLVDDRNPTGYAQVVEELQNNAVVRVYTYGHDLLSMDTVAAGNWTAYYYLYDGNGNVRLVYNQYGSQAAEYNYDAFGTIVGSSGTLANNYLFAGEQFDPDLGLYFLRARYMSTEIGRFWTMDTFEGSQSDPLSLHKYLYVANNPVDLSDPSGHDYTLTGVLNTTLNIANVASRVYSSYKVGNIIGTAIRFTYDETLTLEELVEETRKQALDAAVSYAGIKAGGFIFGRTIGPISRKLTPLFWKRAHDLGDSAEVF